MDREALIARNRKAAASRERTREARAQARLEEKLADAPRGIERGNFTVREILERVRANAARDAA